MRLATQPHAERPVALASWRVNSSPSATARPSRARSPGHGCSSSRKRPPRSPMRRPTRSPRRCSPWGRGRRVPRLYGNRAAGVGYQPSRGILQMRGHACSGVSRIPRPVKIPSGIPYPGHHLRRISPAQNVPVWCSIGHYSYDKIAEHNGREDQRSSAIQGMVTGRTGRRALSSRRSRRRAACAAHAGGRRPGGKGAKPLGARDQFRGVLFRRQDLRARHWAAEGSGRTCSYPGWRHRPQPGWC